MHPTYLSAIERGIRNPSWTKLCDLAQALRIPLYALARAAEGEAYGAFCIPGVEPLNADRPSRHASLSRTDSLWTRR